MPGSWLSQYSPVNGRSVPFFCVTWYCSGDSASTAAGFLLYVLRHSTLLSWQPYNLEAAFEISSSPHRRHTSVTASRRDLVHDRDDLVGDDLWRIEHHVVAAVRNDHILRRAGSRPAGCSPDESGTWCSCRAAAPPVGGNLSELSTIAGTFGNGGAALIRANASSARKPSPSGSGIGARAVAVELGVLVGSTQSR